MSSQDCLAQPRSKFGFANDALGVDHEVVPVSVFGRAFDVVAHFLAEHAVPIVARREPMFDLPQHVRRRIVDVRTDEHIHHVMPAMIVKIVRPKPVLHAARFRNVTPIRIFRMMTVLASKLTFRPKFLIAHPIRTRGMSTFNGRPTHVLGTHCCLKGSVD